MTRTGHDFCGSNPLGTSKAIFVCASLMFPSWTASAFRLAESGTSTVKTSPGVGAKAGTFAGFVAVVNVEVRGGVAETVALGVAAATVGAGVLAAASAI